MRIPMQQADAAGGGQGGGTGAAAAAGADKTGTQQQAGQQAQSQGADSSQTGTSQQSTRTGQSSESAKGAGADKAKTGDQAQLAIKLPDGAKVSPKFVDGYSSVAKKLGLSQEQAQGVVDFLASHSAEGRQAEESAYQKQVTQEVDALKNDKQFGGQNYDATIKSGDSAMKQFFGEKFVERAKAGVISATDPDFRKGLALIRSLISEDAVGDKQTNPPKAANTREAELRKMFPNSYDQMVHKRA